MHPKQEYVSCWESKRFNMKRIICVIDYTKISTPDYQYRGEKLEEIINRFTFHGKEPFNGKFFQYAKGLPRDREDTFVLSKTCLINDN